MTSSPTLTSDLRACHCCGRVHRLPQLDRRQRALCTRCRTPIARPDRRGRRARQARAAALAALILYPLAISLPIMRIERFGHVSEASIWNGAVGLLREGHVFVGAVVLLCSMVLPIGKLLGLWWVTRPSARGAHAAWTYRWIEWTGRWGMLDVLLIAVVVAWIKIGDLVSVRPGPAAAAFTLVVLLSLLASARFDPHALWEGER